MKIQGSLAAALLVVGLGSWAGFRIYGQIRDSAQNRLHVSEVTRLAGEFAADLTDAETGQRGYVLTGDVGFLQPYDAVVGQLPTKLNDLSSLSPHPDARQHLDMIRPLLKQKLAIMAEVIALCRQNNFAAGVERIRKGDGKKSMDAIRQELKSLLHLEDAQLSANEADFQQHLHTLFNTLLAACLFTILWALAFGYLIFRESQHKLAGILHLETESQLAGQQAAGQKLLEVNISLQASEEQLAVTLNSIGDAVIATDKASRVTLLNPLAEKLTGWSLADAKGRDVSEIFRIISKTSREPSTIPVADTLSKGTIHGLANHTVLLAKDGLEYDIADSCAPILNRQGGVIGAVLVFRDVTGVYAVQQALRDTEARTAFALQMTHTGGWEVDLADNIAHRTPGHGVIFGYKGTLPPWSYEIFLQHVITEDREEVDRQFREANASAGPWAFECRIRRADGEIRWIWEAGEHLLDAAGKPRRMASIIQDITERKMVEAERNKLDQSLRDQQFYTRSLIESNIDALMTTGPGGTITDVNKQMEALTGRSREELIGALFKNYFTDPARAEAGIKRVLLESKVTDYELTARAKDGTETVVSYNATNFYDAGGVLQGVFAAARDVTERKRWDCVLAENMVELEKAKATAEKANKAKSDFLSSMSHELRSPLNAILGFAQLMESDLPPPSPGTKASIDQILHAGWYLLELINEILDLAVIESGHLSLSLEAVSLSHILFECQAMIEPQAQRRGITMTFPKFDHPVYVRADHTRVKQVLINLLSNAIKYNETGGTVVVTCTQATSGHFRISVTDTGAGLSPENLAQLFQPFNRLGQEAGGEEGTGIGLVVSKRLIELMEGMIGVESTVGAGSTFWIDLVTAVSPQLAAASATDAALSPAPAEQPTTKPRLLLYVEDNAANLTLIEQLIGRRPEMRLLTARNGKDGIYLAKASVPDVILMDINLPGINGIEAMKILRLDPVTAHIPIIALSANAIPSDIEKGLEAGFFRYLTKPIQVNQFFETLAIALEQADKAAPAAPGPAPVPPSRFDVPPRPVGGTELPFAG